MNFYIRLLVGFVIGFVLLVMIGAVTLRESFGGQDRFDYTSPNHPRYCVEIYEHPGFGGNPSFSLFVVDSGVRKYLGDFGTDSNAAWTDNLAWSNDGLVVVCKDSDYRSAYVFGERKLYYRNESRDGNELNSVMTKHGGRGPTFFDFKFDPTNFVWRDFVPREKN